MPPFSKTLHVNGGKICDMHKIQADTQWCQACGSSLPLAQMSRQLTHWVSTCIVKNGLLREWRPATVHAHSAYNLAQLMNGSPITMNYWMGGLKLGIKEKKIAFFFVVGEFC